MPVQVQVDELHTAEILFQIAFIQSLMVHFRFAVYGVLAKTKSVVN